ncbi:glycosyltransferase [Heyndrickxia oleronia]|uniref:glycosyltransferase family 2 protein n=1 Tax=Heyndrickxia oleronia TaxID=38875 RepID=UPI00203C7A7F|nr:glycosyltransferase family 2 protein [Heyndrickxia oleronia]MCM3455054.1 glycosyltransferase [Heyndrickxia oleronia]
MARFAIIMPVFNKMDYLSQAIDSVINQTLDFREHIELIIINDGSTDNSSLICKQYKERYPSHIKYVETNNTGPGAARNLGCKMVSEDSDFIGFLDADDTLELNALEKVDHFFSEHPVDLAILPIKYVDSKGVIKEHALNYRFRKGDRIINILEEYSAIHYYAGGVFIKKHLYENNQFSFVTSISYWEDALSFNRYLIENNDYGVVTDTAYYYRREDNGHSLVDESWGNRARFNLLDNGYKKLIDLSLAKFGTVIPYIQYLLVYHIKLYLYKKNSKLFMASLNEEERERFIVSFINIIRYVDDRIILEQKMNHYFKEFLISLKRNGWPLKRVSISNSHRSDKIIIKQKTYVGLGIKIEGYYSSEFDSLTENDCIYIKIGKKLKKCPKREIKKDIKIWGVTVRDFKHAGFEIFLPLHRLNIEFYLSKNGLIHKLNEFNYYVRVMNKLTGLFKRNKKELKYGQKVKNYDEESIMFTK